MKVAVVTEIKTDEYRVALTPIGVRELVDRGHEVLVQRGAGEGSAISDADYEAQGGRIVPTAEDAWGEADMLLKVKEPQTSEVELLRAETILFTYLHLAPAPELTAGLRDTGATCIAYETVEDSKGSACHCWPRCRRSRARSRPRRAPSCWRSRSAVAGSCSAECPESRPRT